MQLVTILLITISILIVLSGFSVYVGSKKSSRVSSAFFFAATIFGALWALSIAAFLALSPSQLSFAPVALLGIYSSALFLDTCLVGHAGWKYPVGKIATCLFFLYGLSIVGVLLFRHDLLYTDIILSYEGNKILFTDGWFRWAYLAFFSLITFVLLGLLLYRAIKTSNHGQRMGLLIFIVGLSFTGIISLIFDLLLTYWVTYSLIWVGPITMAATILTYYYAILRYKIISLNTSWLKTLSYVIILASVVVVYTLVFFAIFTAFYRVPSPSLSIFLFNAIMVAVALLMIPAASEITAFIKSLVQTDKINLTYVIKKLEKLSGTTVDLNELSDFLTDHLHFAYIGLLIDKKLYGSSALPVSSDELSVISNLKSPASTIWQTPTKSAQAVLSPLNITAVAELRSSSGAPLGQMLFGHPNGRMSLDRHDIIQLEMITNLVALLIESNLPKKRQKKS